MPPGLRLGRCKGLRREPVGNDQGVHTALVHQVLHVATDGGDDRARSEPTPIDAVEPKDIVGIPEEGHLISYLLAPQQPVKVEHGINGVPLLCQDGGARTALQVREEHLAQQKWWE